VLLCLGLENYLPSSLIVFKGCLVLLLPNGTCESRKRLPGFAAAPLLLQTGGRGGRCAREILVARLAAVGFPSGCWRPLARAMPLGVRAVRLFPVSPFPDEASQRVADGRVTKSPSDNRRFGTTSDLCRLQPTPGDCRAEASTHEGAGHRVPNSCLPDS